MSVCVCLPDMGEMNISLGDVEFQVPAVLLYKIVQKAFKLEM